MKNANPIPRLPANLKADSFSETATHKHSTINAYDFLVGVVTKRCHAFTVYCLKRTVSRSSAIWIGESLILEAALKHLQ